MVDPIGSKPAAVSERREMRVAAVDPARATKSATSEAAQAARAPSLSALSHAFDAKPPVDVERVARIKRAVQEGRFPLVPATVADRLIALKLQWNPNEPA